jgi:hypothetical protein
LEAVVEKHKLYEDRDGKGTCDVRTTSDAMKGLFDRSLLSFVRHWLVGHIILLAEHHSLDFRCVGTR